MKIMNLVIGEVIAHRYWIAVAKCDGHLFGPHSGHDWRTDEPTTTHVKLKGHAGVYAIKTREALYAHFDGPELTGALRKLWWEPPFAQYEPVGVVLGTVRLFGTVQQHERGYRGEFGRVNSLDEIILGSELIERCSEGTFMNKLRIKYGVLGASINGT